MVLSLLPAAAATQNAKLTAVATLKAGAAAVKTTPFGPNPDWKGPILPSGVWGDKEHTIYLAGFGNDRPATGMHDDLWARTLVLEYGDKRIAIVSLDLIGYSQDSGDFGLQHAKALLDPALGIQEVLLTCTHNHEGPDTIGLWGASQQSDGKYRDYLEFVDRQIAKAVGLAASNLVPVRMKLGATTPKQSPSLADLQTRTGGRPPQFFDQELRVMQFLASDGSHSKKVVATLVNWNTHPESMEDKNTILTSDFPGALRDALEKEYGGVAVYVSGDLGAVEIVGDNQRAAKLRITFDGKSFPMDPQSKADSFTFTRTEAIGRDVAKAAIEALGHGQWSAVTGIELKQAEFHVPMDNAGYASLIEKGVLAKPAGWDSAQGLQVVTRIYSVRFGDAQILTTPGELFPEVFYGVAAHGRTDCPAAATGRPAEPALRPLMTAKYKFVFGLSPEELGYLVPGYDFHSPSFSEQGMQEAPDECSAQGVPNHYHETNSASSMLATGYACIAAELLSGKPGPNEPCASFRTLAPKN